MILQNLSNCCVALRDIAGVRRNYISSPLHCSIEKFDLALQERL